MNLRPNDIGIKRNGETTGPLHRNTHPIHFLSDPLTTICYKPDGTCALFENEHDIVEVIK